MKTNREKAKAHKISIDELIKRHHPFRTGDIAEKCGVSRQYVSRLSIGGKIIADKNKKRYRYVRKPILKEDVDFIIFQDQRYYNRGAIKKVKQIIKGAYNEA